ncbi:hypothetical protein UG55_103565 [Frankia sp. EI5c]|nr:hypothetical protein UG55_103565 [Frankia sp. EI5c]
MSDQTGDPGWRAGSRGPPGDGPGPVPGHRCLAPATSTASSAGTSARRDPVAARPRGRRVRRNPLQRCHQGFQSPHRPRNSPRPPPRRPSTGVRRQRLKGSLCLRSRRGCAPFAVGVVNTSPEETRRGLQSPHRHTRAAARNADRRCQITRTRRRPPAHARPHPAPTCARPHPPARRQLSASARHEVTRRTDRQDLSRGRWKGSPAVGGTGAGQVHAIHPADVMEWVDRIVRLDRPLADTPEAGAFERPPRRAVRCHDRHQDTARRRVVRPGARHHRGRVTHLDRRSQQIIEPVCGTVCSHPLIPEPAFTAAQPPTNSYRQPAQTPVRPDVGWTSGRTGALPGAVAPPSGRNYPELVPNPGPLGTDRSAL